jgi:UDP-2,4-diacetamido-2,4,6-trideoxy-beta-L-altropyranose hydrolase
MRVALRADADSSMGVGHVMRSITLGQALVDLGTDVALTAVSLPDQLAHRAEAAGLRIDLLPADSQGEHLRQLDADVIVVDGYHLGDLVVELTAGHQRVALIDDNRELPLRGAALIVNQNLHATAAMYTDAADSQHLLLGPNYAMVRKDVTELAPRSDFTAKATKVLVALGGADPQRLTAPIVEQLLSEPSFEVWVAIGPANPERPQLLASVGRHGERLRVARSDLLDAYAVADFAIVAAGTTLWEVGYLGIPALAIVVADNQAEAAAAVAVSGFAEVLDARDNGPLDVITYLRELTWDAERRHAMSSCGRSLFDGHGAQRVATQIRSLVTQ